MLTFEALLIITILVIVTIAAIELGLLLSLRSAASHAAIEAVREAGNGGTITEVVAAVEDALASHNVTVGTTAGVLLEKSGEPNQQQGLVPTPPATVLSGSAVRVTICVRASALPISGQLAKYVSTLPAMLTRSAVVKQECP